MPEIKRRYAQDLEFDSDLFKLEVTNMVKNLGAEDNNPILANVEHCHFYRTFDSNGRKQTRCSFVGGHTHDVEVKVNKNGELTATCSPAIGTKFGDNHTHKIDYLKSDKLQKRKINEDAQRVADQLNIMPKDK